MVKRTMLVLMLLLSFSASYAMHTNSCTTIALRDNGSLAGKVLKAVVKLLKYKNKRERQKKLVEGMAKAFKQCVIL